MPVNAVKGGFRFGKSGKVFPTFAEAARQGRAIKASQKRRGLKFNKSDQR